MWRIRQNGNVLDLSDVPTNAGIRAAEQAWAGGIANFGDPAAARIIGRMTGYTTYRFEIEGALRAQLGDQFVMYRSMPTAAAKKWLADPVKFLDGALPMSFTFAKELAEAWKNFAAHKNVPTSVVTAMIRPDWVRMRGRAEEAELVIWTGDSDFVPLHVE